MKLSASDKAGLGFTLTYLAAMATMLSGSISILPPRAFHWLALALYLPVGAIGIILMVVGIRSPR